LKLEKIEKQRRYIGFRLLH